MTKLLDIREKVTCNCDLYVKKPMENYPRIDIKAGTPFYLYGVSFDNTVAIISGFANWTQNYPIERFTQWFPSKDYEESYKAWISVNTHVTCKKSFIAGYIAAKQQVSKC